MKKFFFSVCALAAVLASCTKSEVINAPGAESPITFAPYSGRIPTSKATSVVGAEGLAQAGGFKVYAFMHKADEPVSYLTPYMNKVVSGTSVTGEDNSTTIEWRYDGITYWPTTNQLDFVAYSLSCGTSLVEDATEKYTKLNYTVPDAVADQKDLLVATPVPNQTAESNGCVVPLVFDHLLSRVGFSLVTNTGNTVPVTVKDVTLVGNFSKTGTVDLKPVYAENATTPNKPAIVAGEAEAVTYDLMADGTFTSVGSTSGAEVFDNSSLYTFNAGNADDIYDDKYEATVFVDDEGENGKTKEDKKAEAETAAAANKASRHMMIIPSENHSAKLNVVYFLPEAGADFVVEDIDVSAIKFEAGKSYEFKFKVSTNTVGFSVTVNVWNTATGAIDTVIELS